MLRPTSPHSLLILFPSRARCACVQWNLCVCVCVGGGHIYHLVLFLQLYNSILLLLLYYWRYCFFHNHLVRYVVILWYSAVFFVFTSHHACFLCLSAHRVQMPICPARLTSSLEINQGQSASYIKSVDLILLLPNSKAVILVFIQFVDWEQWLRTIKGSFIIHYIPRNSLGMANLILKGGLHLCCIDFPLFFYPCPIKKISLHAHKYWSVNAVLVPSLSQLYVKITR